METPLQNSFCVRVTLFHGDVNTNKMWKPSSNQTIALNYLKGHPGSTPMAADAQIDLEFLPVGGLLGILHFLPSCEMAFIQDGDTE